MQIASALPFKGAACWNPWMATDPSDMLTGAQLGAALKAAMKAKDVRQAEVAQAFGITQPSVSEWIRFGRINKRHLPKLVAYFSTHVGPEHWGLPAAWGERADAESRPDFVLTQEGRPVLAVEAKMPAAFHRIKDAAAYLLPEELEEVAELMERKAELAKRHAAHVSGVAEAAPTSATPDRNRPMLSRAAGHMQVPSPLGKKAAIPRDKPPKKTGI